MPVLAIGVYVWNEAIVRWLLQGLRAGGFQGTIILGGPQISYAPAGVHELYSEADVVIRGYGEDALAGVLTSPAGAAIRGVVWRGQPDAAVHAAVDLPPLPSPHLNDLSLGMAGGEVTSRVGVGLGIPLSSVDTANRT
ncbi:MAG: hypothetical protein ACI9K2_007336 [Myxococcota bacterium]